MDNTETIKKEVDKLFANSKIIQQQLAMFKQQALSTVSVVTVNNDIAKELHKTVSEFVVTSLRDSEFSGMNLQKEIEYIFSKIEGIVSILFKVARV